MTLSASSRVNLERFWSTIERSAEIGKGREGGLSRLALSDADKEIRDVFVAWCREAGLSVSVDQVGNIFGRREGQDNSLPPVLMGSHLDTQANGGRFDGIVGVLGALETVRTLNDLGHVTRRPIEIVNWTNEEGARFSPPMLASGCFAGTYPLDWAHKRPSDDGATFGEELRRIGYLGEAPVGSRELDAYFELHIEQGPVLDAEKVQVGVVTHAYTSYGFLAEFKGETAHAGPCAMDLRRNALIAAARLLVTVDDLGWDYAATGGKSTGSRLVAWPNKAGIISDWAQAICDVRHDDPRAAAAMAERVRRAIGEAAARAGCSVEILDSWNWGGAIFDPELVSGIRRQAASLGYTHRDLPSQAGHDAYFLARVCPTAMIFTPCRDGITHNNNELATREDIEPGLNVLLHSVIARADRQGVL
ncbi:Zn-dependent hydrolase [Microvirga sp. 17 mud 1-3]|uniref:Zn-dependent hydrolase n=1 Tax=Microvirga sp. 17 mud 1-3 TaxID=2082949 RepID=UPI000D6AA621|nr:Zn-dependent hydrolase [Microvirga sp. 17 mud 1-3]AWM87788.1 Zn-dependent hydrolase [Microvirga sp. 17 mud 1-3]